MKDENPLSLEVFIMANSECYRKVGGGVLQCCVCGRKGNTSKTAILPASLTTEGLEVSEKNLESYDDPILLATLWPIHTAYKGVVGQGELPVKIHAHFPDVPRSRLIDASSSLCTTCFKIVYNVLRLERQMLQIKAKITVKAGSSTELRSESKLIYAEKALANKTQAVTKGVAFIQRRKNKCEAQEINQFPQRGYRTRAKRKAAFAGLSEEIIQAELEDVETSEPVQAADIIPENESVTGDPYNKATIKKLQASLGIPRNSSKANSTVRRESSSVQKAKMKTRRNVRPASKRNTLPRRGSRKQTSDKNKLLVSRQVSDIPEDHKFFCCPKCCLYFKKEELKLFEEHIREGCGIQKRFPCEQCGHLYKTKTVLAYHVESMHQNPHPMSKSIQVKPREEYVSEMSRIYDLHQQTCECNDDKRNSDLGTGKGIKTPPNFKNLLDKIKKELEDDNWPTEQKSAEALGKSSGSWKCWICFYESHQKSFWVAHMNRIHPNAKGISLVCDFCQFPFTRKHHLREHLHEVHIENTGFKCDKCGRKFLHKNSQHTCETIKCDICEKTFGTRGNKSKHMLSHPDYRPYPCEVCTKTFQKRDYLALHMRTHNDIRPYQCEFCSKRFRSKSHYNNHRRIHTGEKPYVCYTCGKCFISPQCLNNHLLSHEDKKNFSCNICNKTFRTAYDVKRHQVIHTGSKPFKCNICKKAFNRRGNCLAHERNHIGKKCADSEVFSCDKCPEVFDCPDKLEMHKKDFHKQQQIEDGNSEDGKNLPGVAISESESTSAAESHCIIYDPDRDGAVLGDEPMYFEISEEEESKDR